MNKRASSVPPSWPPNLPISAGVVAGSLVFLSGQVGADPATGDLAEDLETQTRLIFQRLESTLRDLGLELQDVVKVMVFLTKQEDFPAMNRIFEEVFSTPPPPARSTIVCGLARPGLLIEIEAIALTRS